MDVSNKALVAYIDAIKVKNDDPREFFEDLGFDYNSLLDQRDMLSWEEFSLITKSFAQTYPDYVKLVTNTGVENSIFSSLLHVASYFTGEVFIIRFLLKYAFKALYRNITLTFSRGSRSSLNISFLFHSDTRPFEEFVNMYVGIFRHFPMMFFKYKKPISVSFKEHEDRVEFQLNGILNRWSILQIHRRFFVGPRQLERVVFENLEYANSLELKTMKLETMSVKQLELNRKLQVLNRTLNHDIYNKLQMLEFAKMKISRGDIDGAVDKIDSYIAAVNGIIKNSQSTRLFKMKIDIRKLVQESLNDLSDYALNKNVELRIDAEADVFVETNPTILKENILTNLIQNAIKFSSSDSSVTVKLSHLKKENLCVIEVIDEGVGMNQKTLRKLYNLHELDSSNGTMNEQGSGNGLAIAIHFIEEIGGEFKVTSELDKGTNFTFILNGIDK